MILEKIVVGSYGANCYILADSEQKKGVIIDPGAEGERILKAVESLGIQIEKILLTHGHGDHIGAVPFLREKLACPVLAHFDEVDMLEDASLNLSSNMKHQASFSPDDTFGHGTIISFGAHKLEVLHTPGHTKGGVCFLERKERVLFSGDTLFYGSVGRSDLFGGNHKTLIQSIQREIMSLEDSISVYCGHGSSTSVGFERRKNPFIQG